MKGNKIMTTNTALQVTNFNFYGDDLIALRDNATGNIYAAINHILKGIGFNENQIMYQQRKLLHDELLKSHLVKFLGVDLNMPSINEIWCISNRKLPMALAKISITPKMKKEQPEMSEKLLRYQDKCADVLASVFIDHKTTSDINLQPLIDTLITLTQSMTTMQQDMTQLKESQQSLQKQIPRKKFSSWTSKMFPKYQLLMDYFDITRKELYHNLYIELQNTYPDIDISQEQDDYCFENGLDSCFTLDVIEHNKNLRMLFSQLVDSLLEKYKLASDMNSTYARRKTIFDD